MASERSTDGEKKRCLERIPSSGSVRQAAQEAGEVYDMSNGREDHMVGDEGKDGKTNLRVDYLPQSMSRKTSCTASSAASERWSPPN
ncbi:unnamed protein product [Arctogadus glacialis]